MLRKHFCASFIFPSDDHIIFPQLSNPIQALCSVLKGDGGWTWPPLFVLLLCLFSFSGSVRTSSLPSSSWWCWHTGKQSILCIRRLRELLFRKKLDKKKFWQVCSKLSGDAMVRILWAEAAASHREAQCYSLFINWCKAPVSSFHVTTSAILTLFSLDSCFPTEPCIYLLLSSVYYADTLDQLYDGSDGK